VKPTAPANRPRDAIPDDVRDELLRRFRNGMLVGLSDTLSAGTRPGERKARLLLEVLRDRPEDVLRFAHDLNVPPTSNQAERDLRPSKICECRCGAPGWRTSRLGAGDPT
jgi:hypothetical protein